MSGRASPFAMPEINCSPLIMPLTLRGFLYFGDLYRQLIPESERLYGTRRIELPAPKYIVFYNGSGALEGARKALLFYGTDIG